MKLTKRSIEGLTYDRETGAHYTWDSELTGFGVRTYPSGRKSYLVTYRVGGQQRFFTFARVGETSVKDARTEAMEILASTRRGIDPAGDRIAYRRAPTMKDVAERYMREHARPRKKPSGVANDERMFRLHILPRFAKRKAADMTRADMFQLHAEMADTPYQANRALAVLSKAFNLCEVWGWRQDGSNPCRHVQRYREEKRERYLSKEELARLTEVLREVEEEDEEYVSAVHAIRLLLLTGCRSGEIKSLRWNEVDFERKCLRLPDSKTGRKTVYLNSAAIKVLQSIERDPDNEHVIVGKNPGSHLIGLSRIWYRIRERAGLEDVRLHDLRHTFASIGAGIGLSLPMIGRLLGHTVPATTARYAHLAAHPMHEASERVGKELTAAFGDF